MTKLKECQEASDGDTLINLQAELEKKKRELKKVKDDFRKAEERNKNLLSDIEKLNKNVSSLENLNTHLKLMNAQAMEVAEKSSKSIRPRRDETTLEISQGRENISNRRNSAKEIKDKQTQPGKPSSKELNVHSK